MQWEKKNQTSASLKEGENEIKLNKLQMLTEGVLCVEHQGENYLEEVHIYMTVLEETGEGETLRG